MKILVDRYGRAINYIRISVTDRCNLRCKYCMPEQGIINKKQDEILTFEEIEKITRLCIKLGIDKIRLTGGEPLVRKGITKLIRMLSAIKGINDLSMTTNGILLSKFAWELKSAGLNRLNVSVDSLDYQKYAELTRFGSLKEVLQGINSAFAAGFSLIKVNVIILDSTSEKDIEDFIELTIENLLHIRFLELMPVRNSQFGYDRIKNFSINKIMEIARRFGDIEETTVYGSGPLKKYFKLKNAKGTFGIIAAISDKFCAECNRIRLTADGFIKTCLHSNKKFNLLTPLRTGASEDVLIEIIKNAVFHKPQEHRLDKEAVCNSEYLMCQIGG